ncbi:methylated-DNA--[protein]-cysteine S-methyltransferase [Actinoallomurus rhizosphaericola]|uniref:methylated-DNA--[protein]-cysteine S-methyltransferase n=1 Tax=Actinoallomurus rhizosphaericola TaxID=2952536 RepID=UPI0020939DB3|nr:methylated-DNA--[protein]-cysteine S-methyltransferase [Actinoallomurus rhizosphaericola]MCO5997973.1 methylated-DNA--[protein]-cysteine S-methyltransferase [Actinoallomurus rhizosphaericola]
MSTVESHGPDPFDQADPLIADLGALTAGAPAGLLERVAARWVRVDAAIGGVYVAMTDQGVAYLRAGQDQEEFAASFRGRFARPLLPGGSPPPALVRALRTGRADGLHLDLRGLRPFEEAVLRAAATIPRGEIRPYAWIAERIGRPKAVRAVGTALGRNPVPLLIPCHRVTRSDGRIGQYVFGAPAKEHLLRTEQVNLDEVGTLAAKNVYFVGSDTTGVVCFPSCRDARRITPAHRQGFRTLAQAESAGYRPCRHCRPGGAPA